jgi:hypothetical protein
MPPAFEHPSRDGVIPQRVFKEHKQRWIYLIEQANNIAEQTPSTCVGGLAFQ